MSQRALSNGKIHIRVEHACGVALEHLVRPVLSNAFPPRV